MLLLSYYNGVWCAWFVLYADNIDELFKRTLWCNVAVWQQQVVMMFLPSIKMPA